MSSRPTQRDRGQDLSTFSVNRPNTFTKVDLTPRRYHFYNVLLFIFGTVFPPLAVAARFGIGGDFWLNLLLTICGYIPGHGHNFYIQNIRNNKNHRRTPKWALRYGLVDDSEIRRKEKRSQWAGRYNDRLPQSTLEGREVEEGQVPDRPQASREGSAANGSDPALWGREEEQFYGQRRRGNGSESNSSSGGGGRWRYPANFDDAEMSPTYGMELDQAPPKKKGGILGGGKKKKDRWALSEDARRATAVPDAEYVGDEMGTGNKRKKKKEGKVKRRKKGGDGRTASTTSRSEIEEPEDPVGGLYGNREPTKRTEDRTEQKDKADRELFEHQF
ncbi:hypothetical protein CPB86DRAFT_713793 [Serendipita vermifera]|nr:hypothetical protein CPB86DRAFT_713793 [Serendipita vermifera]